MTGYIEQAIRTESIDLFKVDSPRLLHAAVGVTTEVAELLLAEDGDTVNVKEEMGDVCWYLAVACDELKLSFQELADLANQGSIEADAVREMLGGATGALDVMKRGLFYGVELDLGKFCLHLGQVAAAIKHLAEECGWDVAELETTNIAKLSRRYPEKFTTEAAVNRDLEAEREALA